MKRIIIVHGWGGTPQNDWLPCATQKLEAEGHDVIVPEMPNTEEPEINAWVSYLTEVVKGVDEQTYFVGHSIGCQTILRFLENVKKLVGGAVFVAGWFYLENLEDEEAKAIAKPWLENEINLEKVQKVLPKSTIVISDNDPYGAFEANKSKFSELNAKEVVLHNAGHICESKEPKVLEEILEILN